MEETHQAPALGRSTSATHRQDELACALEWALMHHTRFVSQCAAESEEFEVASVATSVTVFL